MKVRKGKVDLITLAVGMIPMVLFIVLSGYILVENPVETDLSTQISFEESRFESIMALSHVLVYNDTLERINNYSEFPADSDTVEATLENDIGESTSYLADALKKGINTYDGGGVNTYDGGGVNTYSGIYTGRSFMVNVTMPEEDNITVTSPNTEGAFISSKANIASPKTDPITLEVILDRD